MVAQIIGFKESIWNKGLRYRLCTHKSIIKQSESPSLSHYNFSSSIFEVSLLGRSSYALGKNQGQRWVIAGWGFLIFCHLPRLISCFISLWTICKHRSQHLLPLRSHYHLPVSLDIKLFVWMLDGIEEGGGGYSREQQIYIAGTFRGYSMRLKVLELIEYVCRGAATLTRKCAGMFTSVRTNDVPSEPVLPNDVLIKACCQMQGKFRRQNERLQV